MRLIDPGPGELLDRETILVLKLEAGRKAGIDVSHWEKERLAIQERLSDYRITERWYGWHRSLMEANHEVWQAIDNLRATVSEDTLSAAHWGRVALRGNDERARLIHEINKACGGPVGVEKLP